MREIRAFKILLRALDQIDLDYDEYDYDYDDYSYGSYDGYDSYEDFEVDGPSGSKNAAPVPVVEKITARTGLDENLAVEPGEQSENGQPVHDYQQMCLQKHNDLRAKHENTAPMTLDNKLCETAVTYARKLVMDQNSNLQHSSRTVRNGAGENLFLHVEGSPDCEGECSDIVAVKAAENWYNEKEKYDFATGSGATESDVVGHFTQLVWDSSTKLGVGMAKRGNRTIVVCHYDPPGNVIKKNAENVKPLVEEEPVVKKTSDRPKGRE